MLVLYLLTPSIWSVCFLSFQTRDVAGREFFDLDPALELHGQAAAIYEAKDPGSVGLAGIYNSMGAVHRVQKDHARALERYGQAAAIYEAEDRGLLLQAQRGGARRRYRPGRRQQLDRPVSGSRVGPDTDQSSSALLARRGKGSAAGCGSC